MARTSDFIQVNKGNMKGKGDGKLEIDLRNPTTLGMFEGNRSERGMFENNFAFKCRQSNCLTFINVKFCRQILIDVWWKVSKNIFQYIELVNETIPLAFVLLLKILHGKNSILNAGDFSL